MEVQILENAALIAERKAEIDVQIATAKAYPRSVSASIENAKSIATISTEVAESCVYALPRSGRFIEGPSVRLAEIVASSFGNIRTGARIIHNDGKTITAEAICHDLETNNAVKVEVKRKITDRNGKTYSEDMQVMTGNAACAIAFRNAVFKVIPAALVDTVYQEVKKVGKGDAKTLTDRRDKALNWLHSKGIKDEQICRVLEIQKVGDIDLECLQQLNGIKNAITQDGADIKQIFEDPKKTPGKAEFNQIKEGLKIGTVSLDQVRLNYDLTDEQDAELETIQNLANNEG